MAGCLTFLPWLPTFLFQSRHTGTPWATPANFAAMVSAIASFAGGTSSQGRALALLFFALAGLGLFGLAVDRRHVDLDLLTRPRGRPLAIAVTGTLAAAIIGGFVTRSAFDARYASVVFVPLLLLVALGIATFRDRRVRAGMVVAAGVLGLAGSLPNVTTNRTQAGQVAAHVKASGKPGDVIAYCPDQLGPAVESPAAARSLPTDHLPPRERSRVRELGQLRQSRATRASVTGFAARVEAMADEGGARHSIFCGVGAGLPVLRRAMRRDRADPAGRSGLPGDGRDQPATDSPSTSPCGWCSSRRTPAESACPRRGRPLVDSRTGAGRSGAGAPRRQARSRKGCRGTGVRLGHRLGRAVVAVLPAWVVSRAIVLVALVVAHLSVSTLRPHNLAAAERVHQGLLSWDAGWYVSIAAHGYVASGTESVRFFPGFPMLARALTWLPGVSAGTAVIIVANLAALGALAALGVLVRRDLGDAAPGSALGLALCPGSSAYAFVLGYADSLLVLLAVATVLAVRRPPVVVGRRRRIRRRARPAGGRVAGGARRGRGGEGGVGDARRIGDQRTRVDDIDGSWSAGPTSWPRSPRWSRRSPAPGGTWHGWAPSSVTPCCRSGSSRSRGTGAPSPPRSPPCGTTQSPSCTAITWAAPFTSPGWCCAWLFWYSPIAGCRRRTPPSPPPSLAVSLTSSNLDSFERYALGAFPLVIAASTLTARRRVEITVLVLSGAAMAAYTLAALFGLVVP